MKTLVIIIVVLFPFELFSASYSINGINYNFAGNEATVVSHGYGYSYSGDIIIPETVDYNGNTYTVTRIGNSAFSTSTITNIVMPNTITAIMNDAFYNCDNLSEVVLPVSLLSIGEEAFWGCDNLKSIVFPSSITYIGKWAFINTFLEDIYCYPTDPSVIYMNENYGTFDRFSCNLHVPAASLAAYFTAPVWCNFDNIIGDAIEPTNVIINKDSLELHIGDQFVLSASVIPSNATTNRIFWISTDNNIATVTGGLVTVNGLGECDIIATCYGLRAVCHVSVIEQSYIISLDQHEAMVLPNHILTLIPTATPELSDLAVTSSDPSVAAARVVNGKVQIVGIKEGTTTITVGAANGNAQTDSCEVTVYTERGDVNCDGFINISDVTKLIDFLLSDNLDGFSSKNADTNFDGNVNISDVTSLIDFLLSGIWPWDQYFYVNGITFKMVYVEGGTFMMGATQEQGNDGHEDERPTHQVTLSGYSIGETEVTQALWLAVMGSNPSKYTGDLQRPVEKVSWNDCQTFITKLNQITGRTFRLPTEAEWEYAARGGKKSEGYKYAGSNDIGNVAWFEYNIPSQNTQPVATKLPNELGLYDMSGNVWEWCQDWFDYYSDAPQTNPTGPSSGYANVVRGGSWYDSGWNCRVSYRGSHEPNSNSDYGQDSYYGLRLAL